MENKLVSTLNMSDLINEVLGFVKALLASWKLALLLIIVCCFVATAYYFFQKPKYEGSASFILEEKGSSMGGGLSGLASQFGVDIGSLSGSAGLFAGDNILDIMKSRTIIEKVLLSKVDSTQAANKNTLADLYLDFNQLKKKWASRADLANLSFANVVPGTATTRLQDSVLFQIYQQLTKKNITVERLNKKGSIIEVATTTANEVFSKLFSERLVTETMKMYIDIKTSTAAKNIQRLERRSDSLMVVLNSKSFKSASLQVLDANIAYKSAAVPVEVTQRDKTVTYALYSEVMKNLEASRMALAGQTPIINLLDNSKYPLEDQRKPLSLLLFAGVALGLAAFFVIAFFNYR
ncbi:MAG: Wzz/FepE/Etk N-terminal domain-containing protein [Bacteroidota bacterium]